MTQATPAPCVVLAPPAKEKQSHQGNRILDRKTRRVPKCPECGLCISGAGHANGRSHKNRIAKIKTAAKKAQR